MAYINNVNVTMDPTSIGLDAGARTRISSQTTLGDYKTVGADENGTITASSPGTVLFSQVISVDSVFDPGTFIQDFLSILGMSIANVSDEIVLCGTLITATVASFGSISLKEY